MLLLDTNAVSELRKVQANRANHGVVAWAHETPFTEMFISAITLMETEQGILLIERRDKLQGAIFRLWFRNFVLSTFADRTLPVDAAVALRAAALHVLTQSPNATASSPPPLSCTA